MEQRTKEQNSWLVDYARLRLDYLLHILRIYEVSWSINDSVPHVYATIGRNLLIDAYPGGKHYNDPHEWECRFRRLGAGVAFLSRGYHTRGLIEEEKWWLGEMVNGNFRPHDKLMERITIVFYNSDSQELLNRIYAAYITERNRAFEPLPPYYF